MIDHLNRKQAALCRYSSQTWREADLLPLDELNRRFNALREIIEDEGPDEHSGSGELVT